MTAERAASVDPELADALRHKLVAELTASGVLRSAGWQTAFERVPRHVFVPRYFLDREHNGSYVTIDSANPAQREEWLRAVYTDETLITQLDGDRADAESGVVSGIPTSSSTMPGLMALMLEALDIGDGMRVLEIGTGTGYNAALLCERLGSELVTSIDVDETLVASARKRLDGLGYVPALATADGAYGYPANAPYDRILATVALPHIPSLWLEQARNHGKILVNLHRDLGGGALALLTVHDGRAEGHFLPDYGGFMPVRSARGASAFELLQAADTTAGVKRETALDGQVLDDPAFGFFAALSLPAHRIEVIPEAGSAQLWLLGRDGSWTRQTLDAGSTVIQYGRRRLWDELESAHSEWETLGRPERQQLGLTVQQDGRHVLWCREPGNSVAELAG